MWLWQRDFWNNFKASLTNYVHHSDCAETEIFQKSLCDFLCTGNGHQKKKKKKKKNRRLKWPSVLSEAASTLQNFKRAWEENHTDEGTRMVSERRQKMRKTVLTGRAGGVQGRLGKRKGVTCMAVMVLVCPGISLSRSPLLASYTRHDASPHAVNTAATVTWYTSVKAREHHSHHTQKL